MGLLLLDIADMNLVDKAMLALGRDTRLCCIRLVGADIIVLKGLEDSLQALGDFLLAGAGALARE